MAQDAQGGRPVKATPEDALEVFRERDDRAEPLTAGDVADALDVARRTALNRLNELVERGDVSKKRAGANATVFWIPLPRDVVDAPPVELEDVQEDAPGAVDASRPPEPDADTAPGLAALADVDFPAGREREDCEAAVRAARAFLQENGAASMREIVAGVMPDHPVGYDVDAALEKVEAGDRYRGAWWRKVVKPGLAALDDVEKPPRGASEWTYVGGG